MNIKFLSLILSICIFSLSNNAASGPQTYKFGYIGFHSFNTHGDVPENCYAPSVNVHLYCDKDAPLPTESFSMNVSTGIPGVPPDVPNRFDLDIKTLTCDAPNEPYITMSSPSSCCTQSTNWDYYTGNFYLKNWESPSADAIYTVTDIARRIVEPNTPRYSVLYTEDFDNLLIHATLDCSGDSCSNIDFTGDYYSDWQSSSSTDDQECFDCSSQTCSIGDIAKKHTNKIKPKPKSEKSLSDKIGPATTDKKPNVTPIKKLSN